MNFVPDDFCFKVHFSNPSTFQELEEKYRQENSLGVTHFFLPEKGGRLLKKGEKKKNFYQASLATVADQWADSPVIMLLFHPLTETSRVDVWQQHKTGREKAFCSWYVEDDALLVHPHTEIKSRRLCARGCWSLRGFFWLALYLQIYIYIYTV